MSKHITGRLHIPLKSSTTNNSYFKHIKHLFQMVRPSYLYYKCVVVNRRWPEPAVKKQKPHYNATLYKLTIKIHQLKILNLKVSYKCCDLRSVLYLPFDASTLLGPIARSKKSNSLTSVVIYYDIPFGAYLARTM